MNQFVVLAHDAPARLLEADDDDLAMTAAIHAAIGGFFDVIRLGTFGDLYVRDDWLDEKFPDGRPKLNAPATTLCRSFAPDNLLATGAVWGNAVLGDRTGGQTIGASTEAIRVLREAGWLGPVEAP